MTEARLWELATEEELGYREIDELVDEVRRCWARIKELEEKRQASIEGNSLELEASDA